MLHHVAVRDLLHRRSVPPVLAVQQAGPIVCYSTYHHSHSTRHENHDLPIEESPWIGAFCAADRSQSQAVPPPRPHASGHARHGLPFPPKDHQHQRLLLAHAQMRPVPHSRIAPGILGGQAAPEPGAGQADWAAAAQKRGGACWWCGNVSWAIWGGWRRGCGGFWGREVLAQTLQTTAGGAMTTDAHLAALAIEHQAELHSNDSDFSRFAGLRWRNPLGE